MTKPKWFTDSEGRTLHESETNRHHLIHPKHVYLGKTALSGFRSTGGFVQRMTIPAHKELHANVRPPILINHNLRSEIVKLQTPGEVQRLDPLERLDLTMEFLERMAIKSGVLTPNSRDAWDLLENLREQRTYVELGRVTLIDVE